MTQNPYAQFGTDGGPSPYGPDYGDQPQPRTSLLAITSLVVSVIGCVFFCIPGPGALAMVLGGIAILVVMTSGGRVRGLGFAATAVCLGLLQSIVWFVALFGVYQPIMGGWNNTVVAPVADVFNAIEHKDAKAARALLTPRAQGAITEDMLKDFADQYHARLGAFKKFPENPLEIWSSYQSVAPAMQAMQGNQQNVIPLPGMFEKGNALVMLQLDNAGFAGNKPKPGTNVRMPVLNIGIVTNDGKEIWIMDLAKANALPTGGGGAIPAPGKSGESTIEDAPANPGAPNSVPPAKP